MTHKKMFIIDAMALAFRSYHAMAKRPLTRKDGLPTSAVHGSLQTLIKLIEEENPDYLIAACDSREKTFRHELYERYKEDRVDFPEDLAEEMPYFFKMFETLGIPVLRQPGFEADDIVGTLVTNYASEKVHCYIVSRDKDFMQLINPHVFLYTPENKGMVKIHDEASVFEKFKCHPHQVRDFLALMGDSSDNVPGVSGIGSKGAAKLLEDFGSLEAIYENLEKIGNERLRKNLEEQKDKAMLSYELVTIHTAMTLDFKAPKKKYNWKQIYKEDSFLDFLKEMEFTRIHEKYFKKAKPKTAFLAKNLEDLLKIYGKDTVQRTYSCINTKEAFQKLLSELEHVKLLSFDTETTGLHCLDDKAIGISLATEEGTAYYIPLIEKHLEGLSFEDIHHGLSPVFESPDIVKVAHNLKFDLQMMQNSGFNVSAPYEDTMLMAFLLNSSGSHGMDPLCKHFLKIEKIPTTELMGPKYKIPMEEADLEVLGYYAGEDSDCCLRLYKIFKKKLEEESLDALYKDVEIPLVEILSNMERKGIYLNKKTMTSLSKNLEERSRELESKIFEYSGEEFNISSPKQLQTIIFEKLKIHEELGIKKIKKTQSGYSTDASVLESLSAHPMVSHLLEYRTVTKLKNTYTDVLPDLVHEDTKRLHTHFHQTGTATGRLSSSNPNLQNIPIRTDIGQKIRSAFEGQDDLVLISADYSQIELRLLAHISGDENLKEAFKAGEDIHRSTAAKVFNKALEEVTSDERSHAKAINYGVAYGMGPKRFAETTGLPKEDAKAFIEKYFEKFPRIQEYIDNAIDSAMEKGYSLTLQGRKRIIDGLQGSGLNFVNARNIAVNAPIQGTAADLIKIAMIKVTEEIKKKGLSASMLLQIHDELLFECPKEEVDTLIPLIKKNMESALELSVPLCVDIHSGKNWLEAHH